MVKPKYITRAIAMVMITIIMCNQPKIEIKESSVENPINSTALSGFTAVTSEYLKETNVEIEDAEVTTTEISIEESVQMDGISYEIEDYYINPETGSKVKYNGGKTLEYTTVITAYEAGYINSIAIADEDGFMTIDGRYLIAIGTRFNAVPGQYITVINCIVGDTKDDADTDETNTFTYKSACCTEFIIDPSLIREDIKERGNASLKKVAWDSAVKTIIVYDKCIMA